MNANGVLQTAAAMIIAGTLAWLGHMLNSGHDALTRIEQRLMDQDIRYDGELADHESRIRTIEAAHRAGVR